MSSNEKSTDPGLSAVKRKAPRDREAREAIDDHERAQKARQENLQRLRNERLVREAAAGTMVNPTPELPDFIQIERVRLSTRVRNALDAAGMKSIGDVREASDAALLSLPDLGPGSIAFLRERLGLASTEGVRLPGAPE